MSRFRFGILFDLFDFTRPRLERIVDRLLKQPVGRVGVVFLTLFITAAPYFLFFDPADWPGRKHVAREPMSFYPLFSDDIAYVSASRNWERTVSNLFEPHNTHIVPAWRILTWALVQIAGNLERLPEVFSVVSYSILIAVMLLTARLVARETGSTAVGLAAMTFVGTTSVMLTPATWYSAGQPLWAGFGILSTLWYAQSYRRSGKPVTLVLAALAAGLAGWFWTIGHAAGPAAAVYLWTDRRPRCRLAALAPLAATALAVGIALALGGRHIDSTISFHHRDLRTASVPVQGLLHTCQAIPENLLFANLGLNVQTTQTQGVLITLALFLAWSSRAWPGRTLGERSRLFSPLELTGLALVLTAYIVEWTVRGYMDFEFLRTINLHLIVPWYDVVPQIGTALLLAGWWQSRRTNLPVGPLPIRTRPPSRLACLGVILLVVVLVALNRPRVDGFVRASVPSLLPSELQWLPTPRLQTFRASVVLIDRAKWQRRYLRQLDRCQALAVRMGWGRENIRAAVGYHFIPGTVGMLLGRNLYDKYDAAALLNIPDRGRAIEPEAGMAALAELIDEGTEPRPTWISPKEKWPP